MAKRKQPKHRQQNNAPLIPTIEHALVAKSHTSMYGMHKYWARKPANVVSQYINTYSKKGETVLDPFNGSGVTVLESIKLDRNAIGIDVSAFGIFLTEVTSIPVDIEKLKEAFKTLEINISNEILKSFYDTICPVCNNHAEIKQILLLDNTPSLIKYTCSHCTTSRSMLEKSFDNNDRKNEEKINKIKIPFWVPTDKLIHNSRINIPRGMKYTDLFPHRNLIVLSIIFNEIEKISNKNIKLCLKLAFSRNLAQASKLLVFTPGSGPSWKIRGFFIPVKRMELNVWHYFQNSFDKILKGKEESNRLIGDKNKNLKLHHQSSTDLSNIPDNSIDYIFTDPPYGDSVPYLELNVLWSKWLKKTEPFADEIIITDSPERREKNNQNYAKLIRRTYKELYRVLKPGKFLTVTFHNTDIELYNLMIRAALITGFELEQSIYQPPATISAKAQLAPYGSAIGDYYIRFKKSDSCQLPGSGISTQIYNNIIIQSVKKIIAERAEPTAFTHIVNSYPVIYNELKKRGHLFDATADISSVIKNSSEFTLTKQKEVWFKNPSSIKFLDRIPLRERVESVIINKLNEYDRVTYDQILESVYVTFPDALTPETNSILSTLKEYAEKTSDKKWRAKMLVKQRISQHDSLVNSLCKLGQKCGYDVYGDTDAYRTNLNFKVTPEQLTRIKEIDCIWYKNNKIDTIFEVENSTGITEAFVRASNIPYKIKRCIVIPEERENLLVRKTQEPFIKEQLKKSPWAFIRYDYLFDFIEKNKRKKTLEKKQLFALHIPPGKLPKKTQTTIV